MKEYSNPFWEAVFAEVFPATFRIYKKSPSFIKHFLAKIMLRGISVLEAVDD